MKPVNKILIAAMAVLVLCCSAFAGKQPANVLMLIVDDLKPLIGCYGDDHAITPAMDALASQGSVFLNNQCQQAVCGASRASVLTGLRPDTTHVWDFKSKMRDDLPDLVTLPQYFKQSGYHTASIGKVFDYRCCDGMETNDVPSWSQPHQPVHADHLSYNFFGDPETIRIHEAGKKKAEANGITNFNEIKKFINYFPTTECLDENVADDFYEDGMRTQAAIKFLNDQQSQDKPFFLALGYKKPHLPFVAPKKYWDLYDPETLPLAEVQQMPENAPPFHFQDSWELRNGYFPVPEGRLPDDMQRRMIHGYYACVSYIDAQIAKVMEALRRNGMADNTIVVLWGDHGWHLGDHGMWCKHTNYEQATRTPLIIMDPRGQSAGNKVRKATEFIDIAPTLVELAGLQPFEDFQGSSLAGLMRDPRSKFKPFAVSQFPRSHAGSSLMGYAFRNQRYRLILWIGMDFKNGERSGDVVATELYDYRTDPLETVNLSASPEHQELVQKLIQQAAGFAREHMEISWN